MVHHEVVNKRPSGDVMLHGKAIDATINTIHRNAFYFFLLVTLKLPHAFLQIAFFFVLEGFLQWRYLQPHYIDVYP